MQEFGTVEKMCRFLSYFEVETFGNEHVWNLSTKYDTWPSDFTFVNFVSKKQLLRS